MENMSIFFVNDYKSILKDKVYKNKQLIMFLYNNYDLLNEAF